MFKTLILGQQNSSAGIGTVAKSSDLISVPDSLGKRGEPTLARCPLTPTRALQYIPACSDYTQNVSLKRK